MFTQKTIEKAFKSNHVAIATLPVFIQLFLISSTVVKNKTQQNQKKQKKKQNTRIKNKTKQKKKKKWATTKLHINPSNCN